MVQRIQTFDIPGGGICHCTQAEFEKFLDSLPETRYNEASRTETTMIKEVTKYVTSDGSEFDSRTEATVHERKTVSKTQERLERFRSSYSYNQMMREHNLSEYGTWHVQGEDPNCDLGGHHHMPSLGYYEGRLSDVIEIAVDLPSFWQWGGGGKITKFEIKPIKVNHVG